MKAFRILATVLALAAVPVLAQVDRATISGTLTDPSGAVVQDAQVTIETPATGFRRTGESSAVGIYRVAGIPVGEYTVTISKAGFATRRYEHVALQVGQTLVLDAQIAVAGAATAVEVVAGLEPLEQTSAEVGIVIGQNQINALPLNGRNWTALLALAPGATNTGEGNQNTVRFNGRSRDENNFTFDGVDATGVKDPRQEANLRLNISLDAIAEFRVGSGLYSAESGNGAGAQMNLVSKTGSNAFHGGAFEYFRNDKLDARRPTDLSGKAPFRLNQFGGNLGGRILRDKTFFFANYEGLEQRLATTLTGSVPSAAFRQSALSAAPALRTVIEAFQPGTSRTSNADIDNLTSVASQPWTEKSGLVRVDHRFSDKASLFVRYNLDDGSIGELRNALLETRTSDFRTQNAAI